MTLNRADLEIDWETYSLPLKNRHCEEVNWLSDIYYKDTDISITEIVRRILWRQKGGEYHGWLVITGLLLLSEHTLKEAFENSELEHSIADNGARPDIINRENRVMVEAGGVNSTFEKRAEDLIRSMMLTDYPARYLPNWKFLRIPKDVYSQKGLSAESEFELSDNPVCRVFKPSSIDITLDRNRFGYRIPGWGNIAQYEE